MSEICMVGLLGVSSHAEIGIERGDVARIAVLGADA
jgi:hypothetical protein